MDKEIIDKRIKNEIELIKMYSFFLIGLITGVVNFVIRYIEKDEKFILNLLIIGFAFLSLVIYMFVSSFIRIKKLTKKLKK